VPERWKSTRVSRSINASSPMIMASISAASRAGQSCCTLAIALACIRLRTRSMRLPANPGKRYILDLRRAQRCDAAIRQVSLRVESAGIAEIARRLQLG
jgi:hypothetical protein